MGTSSLEGCQTSNWTCEADHLLSPHWYFSSIVRATFSRLIDDHQSLDQDSSKSSNQFKLKMKHQSAHPLKYYSVKAPLSATLSLFELWQGFRRFVSDADKFTLRNEATIRLLPCVLEIDVMCSSDPQRAEPCHYWDAALCCGCCGKKQWGVMIDLVTVA